jgi:protein PhnA|tara:strand:+ start:1348 stop:1689 length:342 start_codon:yes stop_codon:yes gene_type:complete
MSETIKPCPQCDSPYDYFLKKECYACPECSLQWNPDANVEAIVLIVKDSNGNVLVDGDPVIVIKYVPVKSSSTTIKRVTKVKRIRLSEVDHNISCKAEGFCSMALKSEFIKKV